MKHVLTTLRLLSVTSLLSISILITACGGSGETGEPSDSAIEKAPIPTPTVTANSSSSVSSANEIPASSSSNSSTSSSGLAAKPAATTNTLKWSHPNQRENGAYLELDEIGGYEIRYRASEQDPFQSVVIEGSTTTTYQLSASGTYDYELAAFDQQGLYSEFVDIDPQ